MSASGFSSVCDTHVLNALRIIQDLVVEVIVEIGALYKASEAVRISTCDDLYDTDSFDPMQLALLDMIWSFAHSSICRFSRGFKFILL